MKLDFVVHLLRKNLFELKADLEMFEMNSEHVKTEQALVNPANVIVQGKYTTEMRTFKLSRINQIETAIKMCEKQ